MLPAYFLHIFYASTKLLKGRQARDMVQYPQEALGDDYLLNDKKSPKIPIKDSSQGLYAVVIPQLHPENHQARPWPKRKACTSPTSGSPVQAISSSPGGWDLKAFLLAGRVSYIPFWWEVSCSLIVINWLALKMSFCLLRCMVTWEVNANFHTDTVVTSDGQYSQVCSDHTASKSWSQLHTADNLSSERL